MYVWYAAFTGLVIAANVLWFSCACMLITNLGGHWLNGEKWCVFVCGVCKFFFLSVLKGSLIFVAKNGMQSLLCFLLFSSSCYLKFVVACSGFLKE
jgi:hypothetical protein